MKKIHLVAIDPQMDFCTPAGTYKGVNTGALYVPGADEDMKRLAGFVRRLRDKLADIHITLDSHHLMDVAHPLFWKNAKGEHPAPFSLIQLADLKQGIWTTTVPSFYPRMEKYVEALSTAGRYPLVIWPPHCLIGTPGASVVPELMEAVQDWAANRKATIDFVTKGSNIYTEHYSAVRAEVPDPKDPTTQLNTDFVNTIEQADEVVWSGEAYYHCLFNTMRDTFDAFGTDAIKKMVVLTDATSPVPGQNDATAIQWFKDAQQKGLRLTTTKDYLY